MSNVYIEARPKGRQEGSPIADYVVEDAAGKVFIATKTEREAIDWAKSRRLTPLLARIRSLNDKTRPAHWKKA